MSVMPYPWTEIDSTANMKIEWADWLNANYEHVRDILVVYGRGSAILNPRDTSEGFATQPFPSYIQPIEEVLHGLFEKVTWAIPEDRDNYRGWLGEYMDTPLLDYTDVNRWFEDADWIRYSAESYGVLDRISGTFTSGYSQPLQHIRFTKGG